VPATAQSFTFDNNGLLTITRPLSGNAVGVLNGTVVNPTDGRLIGYFLASPGNSNLNYLFTDVTSSFNAFYTGGPAVNGATYTGGILQIIINSNTELGLYDFNFGGIGNRPTLNLTFIGPNNDEFDIARTFSVNVVAPGAAVPEPGAVVGALAFVGGLGGLVIRKRRKTSGTFAGDAL